MNSADPLAQLRDIHLPDPVGWWPPAPGWWLVAVLILVALALMTYLWQKRRRARAYVRDSEQLLDGYLNQWHMDRDSGRYLNRANELLKRVALVSFPDIDIAPLSTKAWVDFLQSTIPAPQRQSLDLSPLAQYLYRENADRVAINELHSSVVFWLKAHRQIADD